MAAPNMDQFEAYFQKADLDRDGRISGAEAVAFFQGSNLRKEVLAQIWAHADQNQTGFLSRPQFYNALKLVTVAQSKRELTPDIVKAALYGPASAKIPAPQINVTVPSHPNPNNKPSAPVPSVTSAAPTMAPNGGTTGSHGFPSEKNQLVSQPLLPTPITTFHSQSGISTPGVSVGSSAPATLAPNSSDWLRIGAIRPQQGAVSQIPNRTVSFNSQDVIDRAASGLTAFSPSKPLETTSSGQPSPSSSNDSASVGYQPPDMKSIKAQVSGNEIASNSLFGDVFPAPWVLPKQELKQPTPSVSSIPSSLAQPPVSAASQPIIMPSSIHSLQNTNSQPPLSHQYQQTHSTIKPNQKLPVQSSTVVHGGAGSSRSVEPQTPWPKMTQADIQKYNKVFIAVDSDRDGKITGEQARNLFLSWKLPQDVLRQVWDLSDQDNDSMLSLREFCIALYLMERYREGRLLPSVLPSSIMLDETLVFSSNKLTPGAAWKHTPVQQLHGVKGPRPVASAPLGKPPRPVSNTQADEPKQRTQQKPPLLEKHLLDQLSPEEQTSLTLKFQEATDAEKKVAELEKEISDAKEKSHFYHSKMQELILYKSRCDNRLNEITERSSAVKKEAESLEKKYEEKYKQSGDVASKLTIEEATFRDIQEKKMELYRAIHKLDQNGSADGVQENANRIQLDIEELVKSLNARCKTYGLRAKPTSLLELPFGWQPGIQEGAADWDEDWDKFEDEGFTLVKELTLDVPNVIAPPKLKSSVMRDKTHSNDSEAGKSHYPPGARSDKLSSPQKMEAMDDKESAFVGEQRGEKSPSKSIHTKDSSREYNESSPTKEKSFDGSPHATQSEHGGVESVLSEDKRFADSGWSASDTHYDTFDINSISSKDADHERHKELSLFGSDDWSLAPIKTGSKHTDDALPKQSPYFDSVPGTPSYNIGPLGKQSPIFDSVPSTPSYNIGPMGAGDPFSRQSPIFDSVPSTPSYNIGPMGAGDLFSKQSPFFDSVPSTPSHDLGIQHAFSKQSPFVDSVPSTPTYNAAGFSSYIENASSKKSSFFDDSVPSTPMYSYNNSPDRTRDFSRFDSFKSEGPAFARFDSMSSSRGDADYYGHDLFSSSHDNPSLARFDSFRSTADSEYTFGTAPQETLARFDSTMHRDSLDYGKGGGFSNFSSFDDDAFGSTRHPFKASHDSETPRRESSDGWKSF